MDIPEEVAATDKKDMDSTAWSFQTIAIFTVLAMACVVAVLVRSWDVLALTAGVLLIPNLVFGSASKAFGRRRQADAGDPFNPFYVSVVAVAGAFIVLGVVGLAERFMWFNLDAVPRAFIERFYQSSYDANDHRQFRLACQNRGTIETRTIDGYIYARCGALFPERVSVAAPEKMYTAAWIATANDPEGQTVVFSPKDKLKLAPPL